MVDLHHIILDFHRYQGHGIQLISNLAGFVTYIMKKSNTTLKLQCQPKNTNNYLEI